MMFNERLSIAIPTFKRPELLDKCLTSLINQCMANSVAIYIYDDSCSDINGQIYSKHQGFYGGIFVVKNPQNLGIDHNINKCVCEANTDYVWLIGEDDLADENAVMKILDTIENHSPEYIVTNYQYISNDYNTKLNVALAVFEDTNINTAIFLQKYGWAVGFIGANIIKKTNWDNFENRFLGTYFNHVGKIFSQLQPDQELYLIASPLVYNRAESLESFSWINECFEVTHGFSEMAYILGDKYPIWESYCASFIAEYKKRINLNSIKTLIVLRAKGIYNRHKYDKFISDKSLPKYIISILPVALIKPFYLTFKKIKA